MQGTIDSFNPTPITNPNNLIKTGFGTFRGIFISSATAGTVTVYDGTSAAGTKIIDTFTATAGTAYTFQVGFSAGLFIVLGGTVSATAMWV